MFERKFSDEDIDFYTKQIVENFHKRPMQYVTKDLNVWNEMRSCYAEIERQRALIERAKPFVKFMQRDAMKESPAEKELTQWLKDVERGGE